MHLSLRWRLAAGIVVSFVVTLAVIFATVIFTLQGILANNLDDGLADDGQLIQAEMVLAGTLGNEAALQDAVERYANSTEGRSPFITLIWTPNGEPVAATIGVQTVPLAPTPQQIAGILGGDNLHRTVTLPGEKQYRVLTRRVNLPSGEVAIVQVARPTESVDDAVSTLLAILVAEGAAATVLAVVVGLWLSRGAVRPLERVIDVAADIQASDLRRRIDAKDQPAEVQQLADTFDAMLERLEKAFLEQQHLLMDVSHETRTPLTALKGNIDVMLMNPDLDPDTRGQLERMSSEASRLIRLTSNLLYMASADAGREPDLRPVDLDVVCLEVLRQSRDLRHDVALTMGDEDQVTVMGDRDQIKQMVLNLLENALKYTPAGGHVTLSVSQNGTHASVAVADTGPGIPADILPHIFERFYRGDHRSMMGGTGLGLAIADRIARSHGGRIDVRSEEGNGSTFTVVLPVSNGAATAG